MGGEKLPGATSGQDTRGEWGSVAGFEPRAMEAAISAGDTVRLADECHWLLRIMEVMWRHGS